MSYVSKFWTLELNNWILKMPGSGCLSDSYIYSLFAFVGSVTVFITLLRILTGLRKFFLREGHDLAKRYGHGTWALVTAPTTATGNGFAVQLARLGFNIVLCGRDIEKLHKIRDMLILRHSVKVSMRLTVKMRKEVCNTASNCLIIKLVSFLH